MNLNSCYDERKNERRSPPKLHKKKIPTFFFLQRWEDPNEEEVVAEQREYRFQPKKKKGIAYCVRP